MKRLLAVIAGLALALVGTMAVAAWLSTGDGSGSVQATGVNQAHAPSTTRGADSVQLSWAGSTLADGSPVGGYRVLRHHGSDAPVEVCRTATTTCTDTAPLATAVSYGVVATIGTSWRGPESALTSFTYDDVAPVTTATVSPDPNAAGWNTTSVTVTLGATESGTPNAGVDHISYTVDTGSTQTIAGDSGSFDVSGAGTHDVAFSAVDGAGNTETVQHLAVKIDPNAPVTTATPTPAPNAAGWNTTDVSLGFTAVDSGTSGIKSVTVDGVTSSGSTTTKTVSAEGTTNVTYFATDNADNVEGTKIVAVKIDRTAPTASIDPAGGTSWTNDNTVAISASDATSGIASTQYSVDGGSLETSMGPVTLVDGTRSFRYVVADVAGNVTDRTATIKVDSVKPTASLAQSSGGQPTISGTDTTSGLASVSWRDGGSGGYTTVNGSSTTLNLSTGPHTIWYFATDNAGNQTDPTSQTITIGVADTTAPTITNVQPGSASGGWAAIDCTTAAGKPCATVTDNVAVTSVTMTLVKVVNDRCWDGAAGTTNFGTGCAPVQMTLSGGVWAPANTLTRVTNNGVASFNDGQYTLTITASDAAGNTTTMSQTFTLNGG